MRRLIIAIMASMLLALAGCNQAGESITELQAQVRSNPDSLEARLALGEVYLEREGYNDAYINYREAREIDPASFEAAFGLARAQEGLGAIREGLDAVEDALEIRPESVEALTLRGRLYLKAGEAGEAATYLSRALELDEGNPVALRELQIAYLRDNRPEQAEEAGRVALRHLPEDLEAHLNLATVLVEQGKSGPAEGVLRDALKLHPNDPRPPLRLAELLVLENRDLEEAVELADASSVMDPGDGSADAVAAMAYRAMDREDVALQRLHAAAAAHPRNLRLWMMLTAIYQERGDEEMAARAASMAIRFAPRRQAQ